MRDRLQIDQALKAKRVSASPKAPCVIAIVVGLAMGTINTARGQQTPAAAVISRLFQQHGQDPKWKVLEFDLVAVPGELPRLKIDFKDVEADSFSISKTQLVPRKKTDVTITPYPSRSSANSETVQKQFRRGLLAESNSLGRLQAVRFGAETIAQRNRSC